MLKPAGRALIYYGLFLIAMGLLAAFVRPETGQIGFNPEARTAIVSGSIAGGISIVWGLLVVAKGMAWPLVGGLITSALFLAAFCWRATVGWMDFAGGESEKWFAATLITVMAVVSAVIVVLLARLVRLLHKLPEEKKDMLRQERP